MLVFKGEWVYFIGKKSGNYMRNNNRNTGILEMDRKFIERVLLRCFVLGYAVVIIWFVFFLVADGLVHEVHGGLFKEISERQFQVIHYCGMGL